MASSHKLKSIQVRLDKVNSEIKESREKIKLINSDLATQNSKLNALYNRKGKLETERSKLQNRSEEVIIFEHAYLRYLERVKGVNLQELKEEIISNKVKNIITALGTKKIEVPHEEGFSLIILNNVVTTIVSH